MKCKRLKEIHEESNTTDDAYIKQSIWLDDDKDYDDDCDEEQDADPNNPGILLTIWWHG